MNRKDYPVFSGVLAYFPDALLAVSRVSKAGNDKHNPGEPLHWARGKSMDQLDALTRHLLDVAKNGTQAEDSETRVMHLAEVAWRALAELQLACEAREDVK